MSDPLDWLRPEITALKAYHVPAATGLVKLDAMENPYRWPAEMIQAWQTELAHIAVNRYPDPQAPALKTALRESMGIPQQAEVLLGNGSDELIQMLVLALARPGAIVLAPEPSFAMYKLTAEVCGMQYIGVPLRLDYALDTEAMLAALARHRPALVFIANPNNPTGNAFDAAGLRAIVEQAPGLVVLDEAYYPFTQANALAWLTEYPNLLVMRTVSKLGLAGLRLGLLCGSKAWLEQIDKTRLPYNINVLTQASVAFALGRAKVLAQQAAAIREERARLFAELQRRAALTAYPSEANFILFRAPSGCADALHTAVRAGGVLIKNLHGSHPMLTDCLRVTVGLPKENTIFLNALDVALAKEPGK
ncbi:MAG: histidinol-phosphate transaminase [Nevskiales bacterium]